MTDTTNLRARLTDILIDVDDIPDDGMFDTESYVDDIIDAVREALLSDAAVDAAHHARNGTAVWDFEEREVVEGEEGSTNDIITAALDAALGGDDE